MRFPEGLADSKSKQRASALGKIGDTDQPAWQRIGLNAHTDNSATTKLVLQLSRTATATMKCELRPKVNYAECFC